MKHYETEDEKMKLLTVGEVREALAHYDQNLPLYVEVNSYNMPVLNVTLWDSEDKHKQGNPLVLWTEE